MMNTILDLDAIRQVVIRRGDTGYESVLLDECLRLRAERDEALDLLETHEPYGHNVTNEQFVTMSADLARMRESHARLLAAARAAVDWVGLDGDGISDPARQIILDAICRPALAVYYDTDGAKGSE
jgi:hypothetical protein